MPKKFRNIETGNEYKLLAIIPGAAPFEVIVIGFRFDHPGEPYQVFDQSEVEFI